MSVARIFCGLTLGGLAGAASGLVSGLLVDYIVTHETDNSDAGTLWFWIMLGLGTAAGMAAGGQRGCRRVPERQLSVQVPDAEAPYRQLPTDVAAVPVSLPVDSSEDALRQEGRPNPYVP